MSTKPYRAFYESLLHDDQYLTLSKDAVVALLTLRLLLGKSGIDRCGAGRVADVSALSYEEAEAALQELGASGWIEREGAIVWLIDALANEPNTSIRSESVRKGVVGWVVGTLGPDLPIVQRWADRYGLDLHEFGDTRPGSAEGEAIKVRGAKARKEVKRPKGEWGVEALSRLDEMELTQDGLIGLVRRYLYIGEAPPEGYGVERDVSVLKDMANRGVPTSAIAKAIIGLAWLRDDGLCDELAMPGDPLTLRALWNLNGARPDAFAAATRHFSNGLRLRAERAA